jgi:hypothetical protein
MNRASAAIDSINGDNYNLERLASAVAECDCPVLALLIAEAIDEPSRVWALGEIALAFARVNQRDKVIDTVSRVEVSARQIRSTLVGQDISPELLSEIAQAC